jgi:hypothetical protein
MWTSVTWNSAADFARALRGVVVEFNRKDGADGRCDPLSIGCLIPAGLLVRRFLKTGCPAMLRMTAVGHH